MNYFNLFRNLETGKHAACPVEHRGNVAYAHRQSQKKTDLAKILRKASISYKEGKAIYSRLFFLTPTFAHNLMSCDSFDYSVR